MTTLRITEIYPSIQGESTHAGRPCVFIRLTGCPLRCVWCDTAYAFTGGETRDIDAIVEEALACGIDVVEVTGGEPLAQRGARSLLARLCREFSTVLLETSGALPVADLDPRVHVILDLKAPGSGEVARNDYANVSALKPGDELKIVLADRVDYDWAKNVLEKYPPADGIPVHFSPVHGVLDAQALARWIIEDRLTARLQLQQHKFIWDPKARGV